MILPLPLSLLCSIYSHSIRTFRRSSVCLLLACFFIPIAHAELTLRGFGTLALTLESEDDIAFLRDVNQSKDPEQDSSIAPDSIIGFQVSSPIADDWRFTSQFAYRDRTEQGLEESTQLAFFGYQPTNKLDIRLGRMAIDMFQLSDYRRVDYANLWVRPPKEMYAWILPFSIDGIDAAYSINQGPLFWRFKVQYGETDALLEAPDGTIAYKNEYDEFLVSTISLDYQDWRFRVSYSQANVPVSRSPLVDVLDGIALFSPPDVAAEATAYSDRLATQIDGQVRYWQASAGFDDGTWAVDLELARLSTSRTWVPTGKAGYLSIGRHLDDITPYIVYSRFFGDKEPVSSSADWSVLPAIPAGDGTFVTPEFVRDVSVASINGPLLEQYTISLGMRWDIAPKVAFKVQFDSSVIEQDQYSLWAHRSDRASKGSRINIFTTAVNFVF